MSIYRFLFVLLLVVPVSALLNSCVQRDVNHAGRFDEILNFSSDYVKPRRITVWLPSDYSKTEQYAVLYMHDGQMIFNPDSAWNGQSWEVHKTIDSLRMAGVLPPFIVVGIWNGGYARHSEYMPQKPFELLDSTEKDFLLTSTRPNGSSVFNGFAIQSDQYLSFIVHELKPYIDSHYSTNPDKDHTYIAGSSMGGLISIYALCEYPQVFGRAACLSTHWPGIFTLDNNPFPSAMVQYLSGILPVSDGHRVYFDYGTVGLDTLYKSVQVRVDSAFSQKGYTTQNWMTQEINGGAHTERDWRNRFHVPLVFLADHSTHKKERTPGQ